MTLGSDKVFNHIHTTCIPPLSFLEATGQKGMLSLQNQQSLCSAVLFGICRSGRWIGDRWAVNWFRIGLKESTVSCSTWNPDGYPLSEVQVEEVTGICWWEDVLDSCRCFSGPVHKLISICHPASH